MKTKILADFQICISVPLSYIYYPIPNAIIKKIIWLSKAISEYSYDVIYKINVKEKFLNVRNELYLTINGMKIMRFSVNEIDIGFQG